MALAMQTWQLPSAAWSLHYKLHMSFFTLSSDEIRVWQLLRHFIPVKRRWLFEGCVGIPGQLWRAERKILYEVVRSSRPRVAFEVGTWKGGGSTLFIAQALYANGVGELHTVDIDSQMVQEAKEGYSRYLPHLLSRVHFHCGSSTGVYPPLLRDVGKVDFLFLDGQEDREQTYSEFLLFEPFLLAGSILIAHDWCSEKMAKLRPYIESSERWEILHVITPPESQGLVVARQRDGC